MYFISTVQIQVSPYPYYCLPMNLPKINLTTQYVVVLYVVCSWCQLCWLLRHCHTPCLLHICRTILWLTNNILLNLTHHQTRYVTYGTVVLYTGINKVWGFLPKNPIEKSAKYLLSDSMAALVRHSQAKKMSFDQL